jgi:hypothetical protein
MRQFLADHAKRVLHQVVIRTEDSEPSKDSPQAAIAPLAALTTGTASQPKSRRGPHADNEGHRRVAEILPEDWETMPVKDVLELLHEASVVPSRAWRNGDNCGPKIATYPDAAEALSDEVIRQHIKYRYQLGKPLLAQANPPK